MGFHEDFLEYRNALIHSLKDHDTHLRANGLKPGKDREEIVGLILDAGAIPWGFDEGPWL